MLQSVSRSRRILYKIKNRQLRIRFLSLSSTIVLLVLIQIKYGGVTYVIENLMDYARPQKCIYNLTSQQHSLETLPLPVSCQVELSLSIIRRRSVPKPNSAIFKDIPLVTAFSSNHFEQAKDAVASMQKYVPGHKIYVYDLGLNNWQIKEVLTWCGVEYLVFDFKKYPAHIGWRLYSCAWKPAIVMEMLLKYDGIFYFDASIRAMCPYMLQHVSQVALKTGLALLETTQHSVYAATDSLTYTYLTTNRTHIQADMLGAGFLMIINTKDVFNNILNWWIRCSMNANCVSPYASTGNCNFKPGDRYTVYAQCHRYDQSALNLLLLHNSHGRPWEYLAKDTCARVMRRPTQLNSLQICNQTGR